MGCCYGKRNVDVQIELLTEGNIQVRLINKPKVTQECANHILDDNKLGRLLKDNGITKSQDTIYKITNKDIKTSPEIVLEVLESPTLAKGTRFEINAAGYVDSKRNPKDGCTYMGTAEYKDESEGCVNDIVISSNENGMGTNHLVIQYRQKEKKYYIKDYGQGTGTFVKIERPTIIEEGYIISYGESHMHIYAMNAEKIQLKFLDGPKADQIL